MASVAVIQGASGGLGKAFVSQLLRTTQLHVVATTRDPSALETAMREHYPDLTEPDRARLHILEMDVREESTIERAAKKVESDWGKGSLRMLVNVSGVVRSPPLPPDRDGGLIRCSYTPTDRSLRSRWRISSINTKSVFPSRSIRLTLVDQHVRSSSHVQAFHPAATQQDGSSKES